MNVLSSVLIAFLAACSSSGGTPSDPPLPCTTLIVGKDATADGSVLLAHNEDLGSYSAQHYIHVPHAIHDPGEVVVLWSGAELPQVAETFAWSATTLFDIDYVPGDITSGVNEHQVTIANNLAYARGVEKPLPTEGRIIWTEFTRLALERAASAREAVLEMGELAQTYKLGGDPGTLFGIADPGEGWWIEITQDGQWVAERIADDAVSVRANVWRIGQVDCADPTRFLCSDDLVANAIKRGWYSEKDGPFDFSAVYADPGASVAEWNTHREAQVLARLGPLVPSIRPSDLMATLRDHFEGTEHDLTHGYRRGSPHRTAERPVCCMSTEMAVVCQVRSWLPAEVGAVCWRAMTTPGSSVFVPWYLGSGEVPEAYGLGTEKPTDGSAYWAFRRLSEVVDDDYKGTIGDLAGYWGAFEASEIAEGATLESEAAALMASDPDAARARLSAFSSEHAQKAFEDALVLASNGVRVDALANGDSAVPTDSEGGGKDGGCGCAAGDPGWAGWLVALLLPVLAEGFRRRGPPSRHGTHPSAFIPSSSPVRDPSRA